jgi:hypothetical protein
MESALQPEAPPSFTVFPSLPIEIRRMIWHWASPRRPRVIQPFYRPGTKTWHACKDGCGGLPSIVHVSHEARAEALKGYTRVFDTYIDLEEDTVLISDPAFILREPMKAFLDAEHVKNLSKIAFASDIYAGLDESATEFPTLRDQPPAILRKLEGLTSFTLALSEDRERSVYNIFTFDDRDDEGHDSGVEDVDNITIGPSRMDGQAHHTDEPALSTEIESQEAQHVRRRLDRFEKEALLVISKRYVRDTANVHFESAMNSADHWDDWDFYKALITEHYDKEKVEHPEWTRRKSSHSRSTIFTLHVLRVVYSLDVLSRRLIRYCLNSKPTPLGNANPRSWGFSKSQHNGGQVWSKTAR